MKSNILVTRVLHQIITYNLNLVVWQYMVTSELFKHSVTTDIELVNFLIKLSFGVKLQWKEKANGHQMVI